MTKRTKLFSALAMCVAACAIAMFALDVDAAQVTKALDTFVGSIKLLDNKTLILGTDGDATLQYDETTTDRTLLTTAAGSGLNVLTGNLYVGNGTAGTATINGEDLYVEGVSEFDGLIAADGGAKIPDDVALTLGTDSDVTILYDETTDNQGEFGGPWAFTLTSDTVPFYGGIQVADDKRIYFGTDNDASIRYDETTNDVAMVEGNWVFATTNVSTVFAGGAKIDDDKALTLGDDNDVTVTYDETTDNRLEFAGAPIDFAQQVTCSGTGTIGWAIVAAANQACSTTCTSACVFGFDEGAGDAEDIVACDSAAADKCLCAGAS